MSVLVTGGAGFVGSHLCDRLLRDGHEVICVDSLLTGNLDNIAHLQGRAGFSWRKQDVCEPFAVEGPLEYVCHLASPASPPDYLAHPVETMRVNAEGSRHLLELARAKGAKFFLASTSEVYGDPDVHPQPESYWGHVNPIGPRAVYDEAKRFAEALTMAYHRRHGVDTRIVRIFNTYGPRMRPNDGRAIPNFVAQALKGEPITVYGDGSQTRSFCYIDDLIDGLRRLMDAPVHEPVNVGNPDERTILDIAELVLRFIPETTSKIEFRPLPQDDPKQRRPDLALAKQRLGWQPRVTLDEGLPRTIEWFQHQEARR